MNLSSLSPLRLHDAATAGTQAIVQTPHFDVLKVVQQAKMDDERSHSSSTRHHRHSHRTHKSDERVGDGSSPPSFHFNTNHFQNSRIEEGTVIGEGIEIQVVLYLPGKFLPLAGVPRQNVGAIRARTDGKGYDPRKQVRPLLHLRLCLEPPLRKLKGKLLFQNLKAQVTRMTRSVRCLQSSCKWFTWTISR